MDNSVSIFALSNRVLLPTKNNIKTNVTVEVSIFALSNRVLLPPRARHWLLSMTEFQYSLCRIVYCCRLVDARAVPVTSSFNIRSVESCTAAHARNRFYADANGVSIFALSNRVLLPMASSKQERDKFMFQYSLCRIVYCCPSDASGNGNAGERFNIRSVESCTAANAAAVRDVMFRQVSIFALSNRVLLPHRQSSQHTVPRLFQYSLCRIVYCCRSTKKDPLAPGFCFNIRSVESCTAALRFRRPRAPRSPVSIFALSNRVLLPAALPRRWGRGKWVSAGLPAIVGLLERSRLVAVDGLFGW